MNGILQNYIIEGKNRGLANLSDRWCELSINKQIVILSFKEILLLSCCHSNRFLGYVCKINVAKIISNNANVP